MSAIPEIVADTSFIVATLDQRDNWHDHAQRTAETRIRGRYTILLLDLVLFEAWGVLRRRANERKDGDTANSAIEQLAEMFDSGGVVQLSQQVTALRPAALKLARSTATVNLMDALLVEFMRAEGVEAIASFDRGFDSIDDIERIG